MNWRHQAHVLAVDSAYSGGTIHLPLFSNVDSNKLWHDVQNKVTVIYAKFGKNLFNISKVIGRKTKWPSFLAIPITRI